MSFVTVEGFPTLCPVCVGAYDAGFDEDRDFVDDGEPDWEDL